MKEEIFTIGKVARMSGVGIETIRFYEREGLIPEPPRRDSGYRQYPPATIERVHFVKRAKDLGFTLAEIKELLNLSVNQGTTWRMSSARPTKKSRKWMPRSQISNGFERP